MKLSDSFDPRRLRPKRPARWRWRFAAGLAAVIATAGVLCALAGTAGLLGQQAALGEVRIDRVAGAVLLVVGLVSLWLGVLFWRFARRRTRRSGDLSLSPHLLRKRD